MKKLMTGLAITAITLVPSATAFAQENPSDPNDVQQVDNPADANDDSSGFDDWGLLGLAGLLGLLGLAGRRRTTQVVQRPTESTTTRGY
jgi:hypothetical protein